MQLWDLYHSDTPEVVQEMASTDAMMRLKDVGMNCGCEYTNFSLFRNLSPYSRFDHSIGVALIVWHFTRKTDQAIAGLLHDIATPVFAHVVDFLRGDYMTQASTEADTAVFIRSSSQIRNILSRNNIPISAVEDYHHYPIADNDSPRLSADRLEYTLGNGVNYRLISRLQAKRFYDDLIVGQNEDNQPELMFHSPQIGLAFARTALRCSKIYVCDADRYAMQVLAELLRDALYASILTEEDLYQNEKNVIDKLKNSPLSTQWEFFQGLHTVNTCSVPSDNGPWRQIRTKKRYIDPFVKDYGRISQTYPEFKAQLDAFLEDSLEQWLLGF